MTDATALDQLRASLTAEARPTDFCIERCALAGAQAAPPHVRAGGVLTVELGLRGGTAATVQAHLFDASTGRRLPAPTLLDGERRDAARPEGTRLRVALPLALRPGRAVLVMEARRRDTAVAGGELVVEVEGALRAQA